MPYQVRAKKNPAGGYDLSYGKGQKKLVGHVDRLADDPTTWVAKAGGVIRGTAATKKEAQANWGVWAEEAYGNEDGSKATGETPPDQQSPTPPATPGPPTFKRSAPNRVPEKREPLSFEHNADPFDTRFRTEHKELTPLGVLLEIGAWSKRNADAIKQVEKKFYPHTPFTTLIDQVKYTLARECPDIFNGDDDVAEEPAEEPAKTAAGSTAPAGPPPPPTFNRGGSAEEYLASVPDDDIPF